MDRRRLFELMELLEIQERLEESRVAIVRIELSLIGSPDRPSLLPVLQSLRKSQGELEAELLSLEGYKHGTLAGA